MFGESVVLVGVLVHGAGITSAGEVRTTAAAVVTAEEFRSVPVAMWPPEFLFQMFSLRYSLDPPVFIWFWIAEPIRYDFTYRFSNDFLWSRSDPGCILQKSTYPSAAACPAPCFIRCNNKYQVIIIQIKQIKIINNYLLLSILAICLTHSKPSASVLQNQNKYEH